jgi:hypothetical protein
MTYTEFCLYCRALCLIFNCSESSGIRTPKRNDLPHIKGAPKSTHQVEYGFGRDLVPDTNDPILKDNIAETAKRLGMWTLIEDDHVHIGYRIKG